MKISLTIIVLLISAGLVCGAVIKVPDDYTTIQGAIKASASGDTIYVDPGTYTEK